MVTFSGTGTQLWGMGMACSGLYTVRTKKRSSPRQQVQPVDEGCWLPPKNCMGGMADNQIIRSDQVRFVCWCSRQYLHHAAKPPANVPACGNWWITKEMLASVLGLPGTTLRSNELRPLFMT